LPRQQVVFFPEAFDYIAKDKSEAVALAQPLSGPTVKHFCDIAKAHGLWISLGGFHEKVCVDYASGVRGKFRVHWYALRLTPQVDGTEKLGNTHIVINDNGSIAATYRKLHLFDVDIKVCDNANTAYPYITHVQNSFASTAAQTSQRCRARMATT
jgi:predicted amidohydrolase